MTQRKVTEDLPAFMLEDGEDAPQMVREKRTPDRVPAFLRLSYLPNYAVDRRDDPQAEMEFIITIPYTEDQEAQRRILRAATDRRGVVYREWRNKAQGILRHDTIEVTSATHEAAATMPAPTNAPAQPQHEQPANAVNSVADTVRAVKDLTRELNPAPTMPAPVTLEDVRRTAMEAAEQAAAMVAEQFKQAAPLAPPKTAADNINEMMAIVAAVEKMRGDKPAPAPLKSPIEAYLEGRDMVRELVEEVAPATSEQGTMGKVFSFLEQGLKTADRFITSPTAQSLARSYAMSAQAAQPNGGQAGEAQPQATQSTSDPLSPVLNLIVDELTSDADVTRSCDALNSFLKSHPEYAPTVGGLLEKSSLELVAMLAQLRGAHWLPRLPHGILWCDALKDEVRARMDEARETMDADDAEESSMNIVSMAQARAQAS